MKDWRGTEVTVGATVVWPVGKNHNIREGVVLELAPFKVHIVQEMSGGYGGIVDYYLPSRRDAILARPDRVTVISA